MMHDSLSPRALTEDLVQIKGNSSLLDEYLHLSLESSRKDPHQSLGCKPILGPLLVISLGHVREHSVSSLIDIMDDLAKVGLEVCGCKRLQVGESCSRNISLQLGVSCIHRLQGQPWQDH